MRSMMLGWLGWTIGYAIVIWSVDVAYALLEPRLHSTNRYTQDAVAGFRFVIPLGAAFLIGLGLRTWWWVVSPFLVIVVTMLAFSVVDYLRKPSSQRQQVAAAIIAAVIAAVIDAVGATLAAIAGVGLGRWWHDG
jgi:hypothetical protein